MMRTQSQPSLSGRRVLVVEDEFFVADDLVQALTRLGAEVLGPVPTRDEALDLLAAVEPIDLAVLDINLEDEAVYPVADLLSEQGVPFLFATGYKPGPGARAVSACAPVGEAVRSPNPRPSLAEAASRPMNLAYV